MPLRITRPAKTAGAVAAAIVPRADEATSQSSLVAKDALQGFTPNRWKGLLYKAVGNRQRIANGYGVGGPVGHGGLLPNSRPSPKGTIAAFLARHPEYATRSRLTSDGRYVPQGKSFPMAWHHLPPEARELLKEERLAGAYHSGAPAAPYWMIAEKGMERVGVPAIRYIANADALIRQEAPSTARRILGTL